MYIPFIFIDLCQAVYLHAIIYTIFSLLYMMCFIITLDDNNQSVSSSSTSSSNVVLTKSKPEMQGQ